MSRDARWDRATPAPGTDAERGSEVAGRKLLTQLAARGVPRPVLRGENVRVVGKLTPDELSLLIEHKAAVAKLLREGWQPPKPEPSRPKPQPRGPVVAEQDYRALGLYVERGIVTHAEGDDVARRILSGDIPRAEAEAMQRRAQRQMDGLRRARR